MAPTTARLRLWCWTAFARNRSLPDSDHQPLFQLAAQETPWRRLAGDFVEIQELGGETTSRSAKSYHEILLSAAKSVEAERMPAFDEDAAKNWKKWLSANRSDFPSKLGRIKHLFAEK